MTCVAVCAFPELIVLVYFSLLVILLLQVSVYLFSVCIVKFYTTDRKYVIILRQ